MNLRIVDPQAPIDPNRPVPRGGTELMRDRVLASVPDDLREQVQLVISQQPATFEDKPRILWLHDLPTQPGPKRALENDGHQWYDIIVFVSHWQRQMFHLTYPTLPWDKTMVIPNAVAPIWEDNIDIRRAKKFEPLRDAPIRLAYTSTPHRGLQLVPSVLDTLKDIGVKAEIDIYSSFVLYGQPEADTQFKPLYDHLQQHPSVRYHGTVSNDEIRRALRDETQVLLYPCIYEETSCLAVIEAMCAGCAVVTSSLGALPETCGQWGYMYDFRPDPGHHVAYAAMLIQRLAEMWGAPGLTTRLAMQSNYFQMTYNMPRRGSVWANLFQKLVNDTNESASETSSVQS